MIKVTTLSLNKVWDSHKPCTTHRNLVNSNKLANSPKRSITANPNRKVLALAREAKQHIGL